MKENWIISKRNPELQKKISEKLSISPITAQVLINRGVTSEYEAEAFMNSSLFDLPSPFLMKGMDSAVKRLSSAVMEKEKIAIYGDYDVDGITSTSLLYNFLIQLGAEVSYYNPDRLTEGYGINTDAVRSLGEEGVSLIVSCDCGITAWKEVDEAKKLGIDFIITDHHQPPEKLPDAVAVLNPHLEGCRYPGKEITGVGVVFNLVIALRRVLRDDRFFEGEEPNLGDYLDLVALGTVADCAPLLNINRIFVKEGIKRMHAPKRSGLAALKEVSTLDGKVTSTDIGFRLGPRINAVGRLDSAGCAVELFTTSDPDQARQIAGVLNEQNTARQNLERKIFEQAVSMIENSPELSSSSALVLASREWHSGVIGIVASRIVERYKKPAFLIAVDKDGTGKGSGRGIEGINLYQIISEFDDILVQFGGHELAAGITIREEDIGTFRDMFNSRTASLGDIFGATLRIDCEVDLDQIDRDVVEELNSLEPFGIGNPRPVLLARDVNVLSSRLFKDRHTGLKVKGSGNVFDAICFNAVYNDVPEIVDVVFSPELNEWNGRTDVRITVKDLYW